MADAKLLALIEANTKSYENAMKRIEQKTDAAIRSSRKSIDRLDISMKSISTRALSVGRSLATAFGAGVVLGGIAGITTAMQNAVGAVADLADAANIAGVSAEKLQVLRHALEQNGAAAADADEAFSKLTRSIGETATTGKGTAADAFKALGINVRDVNGQVRATGDVFDEVVDQLSRVDNQAQVAAISAKLFGREAGERLAPTLQQGSTALADFDADLRATGSLMSDELVAKADELDDRFKRLQTTIGTAFKIAAVEVADAVADIIAEMNRLAVSIPKAIDAGRVGASAGRLIGDPAGFRINDAFNNTGETDQALRAALLRKRLGTISPTTSDNDNGNAARLAKELERNQQRANQAYLTTITNQLETAADRMREFGDVGKDVFGGLIADMRAGVGATQALSNALSGLADRLLSLGLDSLFGAFTMPKLSPAAGALGESGFAGLFAEGGKIGAGQWGIVGEHGPEIVQGPAMVEQLHRAANEGGSPQISLTVHVSGARGNQEIRAMVAEGVGQGLSAYDRTKQRQQLRSA